MESIVSLIAHYGYAVLFFLAIFEGPISTIIAGLFVSLGVLNPFLVYAVVMIGDVIGDTICYCIGRWGGIVFFRNIAPVLGIANEQIETVRRYFEIHGKKTITLSKLVHGIGITGLIIAGSLRVSYKKYITMCFSVTLIQAAFFLIIGILFGRAYIQLNEYLNYFASVTILAGILTGIFIIVSKKLKIKIKP